MSENCQCKNPYLPEIATVTRVIEETPNIKSFQVVFNDAEKMKNFKFEPGQVGQLSIFGVGESTFVINSPPTRMEYLQFSVMKAGEVTAALHNIYEGDQIGVRAPLGNWFPYNDMKGKNILFVGGGILRGGLRDKALFLTALKCRLVNARADHANVAGLRDRWLPRVQNALGRDVDPGAQRINAL